MNIKISRANSMSNSLAMECLNAALKHKICDEKPLISIIITNYNYAQYIGECIESCLNQTYPNFEIIVVDDASTDKSGVVIMNYNMEYPQGKIIWLPENKGYSYCKNVGIREARGEYIVHLDADDMLTPNSLKIRYEYFEKNPKIDMIHGRAYRWRWDKETMEWQIDGFRKNAVIHAQTIMIRRSVYERFGLYYEKLRSKADKEMTYRLGVHRDSPLPKLIKAKKIKNFVAMYRKHKLQMHKIRKSKPKINAKIEHIFNKRIKQLKREGITHSNTLFLQDG